MRPSRFERGNLSVDDKPIFGANRHHDRKRSELCVLEGFLLVDQDIVGLDFPSGDLRFVNAARLSRREAELPLGGFLRAPEDDGNAPNCHAARIELEKLLVQKRLLLSEGVSERVARKEFPATLTAVARHRLAVPLGLEVALLDEESLRCNAVIATGGVRAMGRLGKHHPDYRV